MKVYPEYKDSGTPWLGKVPAHWEILRNKNELFPKANHIGDNPNNLPLLSLTKKGIIMRNLTSGKGKFSSDERKFLIVEPGDFVFCHYDIQETPRTIGLSSLLGYITGSYNVYGYRGKNRRFFYYLHECFDDGKLLCPLYKGLRNTIQQDRFLSMRICLPPEEEREAIVAYLDKKCAEIDELISRRHAIIERLKELKQSIIVSAVTRGLDPDVPMKDSGIPWLGKIPTHWGISRLRKLLHKSTRRGCSDLPLLSVVREQGVILRNVDSKEENHNFIPDDLSKYKIVTKGQFVINKMKAWQGSYAVSSLTGIVSPAYFIYDVNCRGLFPEFFNLAIRSKSYVGFFAQASDGVRIGQWDLDEAAMRNIPFIMPTLSEQQSIVDYLDKKCGEIDELVSRQEQIIEKLKELKVSTIAHVVTGKVDVRDAI